MDDTTCRKRANILKVLVDWGWCMREDDQVQVERHRRCNDEMRIVWLVRTDGQVCRMSRQLSQSKALVLELLKVMVFVEPAHTRSTVLF